MTKTSDPDDAQISEEENVDLDFHEEFKPIEINVDQAQSKPNIIMPLEIMNSQLEIVPVVEAKNANSDIDLQISVTEGDINVSLDFLEELKPIKIIVDQAQSRPRVKKAKKLKKGNSNNDLQFSVAEGNKNVDSKQIKINFDHAHMPLEIMNSKHGIVPIVEVKNVNSSCPPPEELIVTFIENDHTNVAKIQGAMAGKYIIALDQVNNKEYWISFDGKYAIWCQANQWKIGDREDLGTNICGINQSIIANDSSFKWPHEIVKWIYYWNKKWLPTENIHVQEVKLNPTPEEGVPDTSVQAKNEETRMDCNETSATRKNFKNKKQFLPNAPKNP